MWTDFIRLSGWTLFLMLFSAASWAAGVDGPEAAFRPDRLRCEYRVNPIGLDVPTPRLSWIVLAGERSQKQTAYQVRVATSLEGLTADRPDLWDSGKVASDRSIQVAYAGIPLQSRMRCFWTVRIWDRQNRPSPWSTPAHWTMAFLEDGNWRAHWICAPGPWPRRSHVTLGYRSRPARTAETVKWIILDLGRKWRLDGIRLLPSCTWDARRGKWGNWCLHYPVRFRVDVAETPDFETFRTVFQTREDLPEPTRSPEQMQELIHFRFPPVTGRYVRLWVNRLRPDSSGRFGLVIGDVQMLQNGVNVAVGARVKASDSIEDRARGWSKGYLVDGVHAMKAVGHDPVLVPPPVFRKAFRVAGKVQRATLHATALGVYEMRLNGRHVGDRRLAPEWTDPDQILQYQTYNVTSLVQRGENVLGAVVADGWQRGARGFFGGPVCLLAQLEVEGANGTRQTVVTDASWRVTRNGPIRKADIFHGEFQDLNRRLRAWDLPGYDADGWKEAHVLSRKPRLLAAQPDAPVRILMELRPVKVTEPRPGVFLFDMGRNMVGWCRLRARGPEGTEILLRHAERLNAGMATPRVWKAEEERKNDLLYTANLVDARQEDRFILDGQGINVLEPRFTYHGFRYVEVTGLVEKPAPEHLTGCVAAADMEQTGSFTSSSPFLNRLMANILNSQRSNLTTGVQTDCPQRSERLGWLGDAQVFSLTACFNLDMAAFLVKWCRHIRLAQSTEGIFADTVPCPQLPPMAAAGWGDGGVILPWRAYVYYGDRRLLADHYASARKWIAWIKERNPGGLRRTGFHSPGDWLNGATLELVGSTDRHTRLPDWPPLPMNTDDVLIATAYYAHAADILSRMAVALDRQKEAEHYRRLLVRIRRAFQTAFVLDDGRIRGGTQGGYALALHFNLMPEAMRRRAVAHLVQGIKALNGRLSTGILTTPLVLEALTEAGRVDVAYRAVFQRRIPSWGYMIDQGATTIWERWDGYVAGRGFQNPGMNSFNHCSFGAVGGWIYRTVLGLRPDEARPGWKHFTVRPLPGGDLTWARGAFLSMHGLISVNWRIEEDAIHLAVTVPANSTATIHLPAVEIPAVTESGAPVAKCRGLRATGMWRGAAVFEADSGTYRFVSKGVRFPPLDRDLWWKEAGGK